MIIAREGEGEGEGRCNSGAPARRPLRRERLTLIFEMVSREYEYEILMALKISASALD